MGIWEYQNVGKINDTEANVYFLTDSWQFVDLTENEISANKSWLGIEKV